MNRSTSSCSRFMGLREELAWANTKNKYNIDNYSSRDDGPLYSWDNLRHDGIKVLARRDRFYSVSSSIQMPSSHIMHYRILGDSTFSDHHLVSFRINLSNNVLGGSSWKTNARFLQEAKDPIKALWESSPPQMQFFTKLRKIIKTKSSL